MGQQPRRKWTAAFGMAIGSRHVARNCPCQDAAWAEAGPLPWAVVADGRGSARCSEFGAQAAVETIRHLITAERESFEEILGTGRRTKPVRSQRWRQWIEEKILPALQADFPALAQQHQVPMSEFEYTLALVVVGSGYLGWFRVGDCGLVQAKRSVTESLGQPRKGLWANETWFVNPGTCQFDCGVASVRAVKAIALHSDGLVGRFYDLRTGRPGPAFGQIGHLVATGQWTGTTITGLLAAPDWDKVCDDDRSLAILARR